MGKSGDIGITLSCLPDAVDRGHGYKKYARDYLSNLDAQSLSENSQSSIIDYALLESKTEETESVEIVADLTKILNR